MAGLDLHPAIDYVGRSDERGQLRAHLEHAAAGNGSLILLSGEPGIGKTRTCEQLATEAQPLGMQVLWGRCWEAGGAPAYWPWVQILRAVLMSAPRRLMGKWSSAHSATIARLLPDSERPTGETRPIDETPDGRFQLFQGVASIIRWAAESKPLLVLIDDLQGADESSLLLLELIAHELGGTPVMIVGTYRELALATGSTLAARLPELTRQPTVHRITLRPLSLSEVEAFVSRVVAEPAAPDVIALLHRLTDGNPLFLIECLRALSLEQNLEALARGRVPLPAGIRDAVRRHLAPLSAECRAVLRAAAVFGRDFSIVMLRDLLRYADDVLLTGFLDEAVDTDILVADGAARGRYRFVHALVREVLYGEMSNVEQLRHHHDAAMLLSSRLGAETSVTQIAHHFAEAARRGADPEIAIRWVRRAGDQAMRSLAYEEADRLYSQGLDILENLGPSDPRLHAELLQACGNACNRLGEIDRAKKMFERAGELARGLGSRELIAEAALGYGGSHPFPDGGYVDETYLAMLERALADWGDDEHPLHARLLTRLASALYFTDQVERRRRLCSRALEMARNSGDTDALGEVLLSMHAALWGPNPGERLEIANELVRLSRSTGNRALAFSAHHWRYCDLLELGDVGGMENEFHACRALAAELREPAMQGWIDIFRAGRALWEGRFEECERLATDNLGLARWLGNAAQTLYFLQMFHLRALQGRADEMLEPMRMLAGLNPGIPAFSVGLAFIHAEAGRLEEARPLAAGIVAHLDRYPRDINYISTLTCLGLVCARLGDAALTAPIYELMKPYDQVSIIIGNGLGYCGSAAHWLGVMAASLGRFDEAAAHFERALAMETAMGSPPWIASTQCEYAALLATGDATARQRAAALIASAAATAAALGMARLEQRIASVAIDTPAMTSLPSARSIETTLSEAASSSDTTTSRSRTSVFRREGDFWTIEHDGQVLRLRDSRGMRYLAHLVRYPHREILVLDLAVGSENGSAASRLVSAGAGNGHGREPIADRRAIAEYKRRLEDIRSELTEAEGNNDAGRAACLRHEMDALVAQLSGVLGLGGQQRTVSTDLERARSAVTKRIRDTLRRIQEENAPLGRHFAQTVQTGYFCAYAPPSQERIHWSF
jgi:tetratricopeptide (TPR) repeat protein